MAPDPLPSATPPPPPPPPAFPSPPGPPVGGYGWPPGAPGYSAPFPPVDPDAAVRSVRSGIELYRWVTVLALIGQVLAVATVLLDPSAGRLASLSTTGGTSFTSAGTGLSDSSVPFTIGLGLIGLISIVLSLVAFFRWRSGVVDLRRSAVPQAPFESPRLTGAAAKAESGYRWSLRTIAIFLLTVLVGGVLIVVIVLSSLHLTPDANGTVPPPTPSQLNHAVSSAIAFAFALAVLLLALELILARFVTESLEGFIETGPGRPPSVDLAQTRSFVYLGILLGVGSALNLVVIGAGAVAIAGPILLYLACSRYLTAFDERLGTRPVDPSR